MKRRKFLQSLGIGAAAVVVPKIVEAVPEVDTEWIEIDNKGKELTKPCIRPKEVGCALKYIVVTKAPVRRTETSYKVGLSDNPRVGITILIPGRYGNATGMHSWMITEKTVNGEYVIEAYDLRCSKLHDLTIGTRLITGGSPYNGLYATYHNKLDDTFNRNMGSGSSRDHCVLPSPSPLNKTNH